MGKVYKNQDYLRLTAHIGQTLSDAASVLIKYKDPNDVDSRIENGVLDVFEQAKQSGKVRYIGFTGHANPKALLRILQRTEQNDIFDTCQMPVNVLDPSYYSFISSVIPVIQKRNIALLAMKTLADGRFFSQKKKLDKLQWQTNDPLVPDYRRDGRGS